MRARTQRIPKGISMFFVALLVTAGLIVAGCTMASTVANSISNLGTTTAAVPVSLTDAPSDQVVAASLTLNSIVLSDSAGKTVSLLTAPFTFEAAHLDAVQEPLFTPAIPEDTYTSVALTYSGAQVAYIDPTTKQVVLTTATLANTSQTFVFPTPVSIDKTTTSLLVDYLVASSVAISGTTVTVTPVFHIAPVPIAAQPTTGTNGLQCGVKGKITALGTNSFTLSNPQGMSLQINVNGNTLYQGISGFSSLAVNALVEVDVETQSGGGLLAVRLEEQVPPNATAEMLVGPVTAVTGSPASQLTMVVQQKIGSTPTTTPVEKDTITVNGSTTFQLPGRFSSLSGVPPIMPFTQEFSATTLFAGQVVAVATNGVTNNAATANSVTLAPQTVDGTITSIKLPMDNLLPNWDTVTLTLASGSWLATVTGQTTVTVVVPIGCAGSTNCFMQAINSTPPAVGNTIRYNGFLFDINGSLTMVALVQADGPGTPIAPPSQ